MKIKKILALGILSCCLFVITGCGSEEEQEEVVETEIPESMRNVKGPTGPPYSIGPSEPPPAD